MTVIPMSHGLILGGVLFALGLAGLLMRRNLLFILISLEIMLNGAGVAFVASYSSAREGAVAFGLVPRWATFLLPDLWNNVRDARNLRQPLLVMQSDADQLFPVSMAKAVYDAATVPKQMVVVHGYRHEDGHQRPTDDYWAPVIRFLTTGVHSGE